MGSWSKMCWICIMDVERLRLCSLTKTLKKSQTAGAATPSADKNCGKLLANGCGTCASPWDRGCREARYARSSGPLPKKFHRFWSSRKTRLKNMAHGGGQQPSDEPRDGSEQRALCCKRTARCAVQQEPPSG